MGLSRIVSVNFGFFFLTFFITIKTIYLEIKFYQATNMLLVRLINTLKTCYCQAAYRVLWLYWTGQTEQFLSSWNLGSSDTLREEAGALWEEGCPPVEVGDPGFSLWRAAVGSES